MAAPTFGRRLAAALLLICLLPGLGRAAERILSFDSRVVVEPDGRLRVTETIRVRSEGREIRRGIYRDFPTDYRGRAGERVRVGFTLLSAERDGRPEPWHSEMVANGLRVYLGDKDVVIPDGEHVYRLAYETTRQLGFFSDYDELYWNVTGNGWIFPIDRVRAVVALPPGARVPLQSAAYTGPAGSTGRAAKIEPLGGGEVAFTATQTLAPHEGLTVAVAWPKGLVAEPSREEELGRLLSDNAGTMLAGAGLVLLLGWYLYAWFTAGRDPEAGPVVPLFSPPEGLSPAACRYLSRLGFDHKALAAALIGLAVKGYLSIKESGDDYAVASTGKEAGRELATDEGKLLAALFSGGKSLSFARGSHRRVQGAEDALRTSLVRNFETKAFVTNRHLLVPGMVLTVCILGGIIWAADEPAAAVGLVVWLSFWSFACYGLASRLPQTWRAASTFGRRASALATTVFATPFFLAEIGGLYVFATTLSLPATVIFAATVGADLLFYHLLKAPTRLGRTLLDQIEGYRLFLCVAEKDRLAALNPPKVTPEVFEAGLAYALALDVEQEWAERFAAEMNEAGREIGRHQPGWYSGSHWQLRGPSAFSRSLGSSFAGSIAASSSPPGRSSGGSSGGGSSGGGGGGGGGGGW